MKSEKAVKQEIDKLNFNWHVAFVKLKTENNGAVKFLLERRCLKYMTEILKLKEILEENYLSPTHSLRYDFNTRSFYSGNLIITENTRFK